MSDPLLDSDGPVGEHARPAGGAARRAGRRRGRADSHGADDDRRGSRRPSGPQWSSRSSDAADSDGAAAPERDDPEAAARGICLRALTGAPKTRKQLADLLAKKEIPADVAAAVLDRFTEVGLIDDAAFAAAWVSSRQSGRGLARRALSAELRAKGVDGEVAATALEAVDPQDEWDTARHLVARKLGSMSRLDRVTAERRLIGMLARKGYGGGLAGFVVREALDDRDAELLAADEAADDADDRAVEAPVGAWSGRRLAPAGAESDVELDLETLSVVRPRASVGATREAVGEVGEGQARGLGRRAAGPSPDWLVDDTP